VRMPSPDGSLTAVSTGKLVIGFNKKVAEFTCVNTRNIVDE